MPIKFTDGNWLVKKGVKIFSPAALYDYESGNETLTLYAPARPIHHKGDTLQGPLFTIELSSPAPEVIRVRLYHYKGGIAQGRIAPAFTINEAPAAVATHAPVQISEEDGCLVYRTGNLSARIKKNPWSILFFDGDRKLTGSDYRSMGYIQTGDDDIPEYGYGGARVYMREQLSLEVGEGVYGLGERFTAFVKNGQTVEIWNKDGGTGSEQAYKNIPFYLTNRGYGVFVNHPERVSFEVASERVSKVQFSVADEHLEYFIINGPGLKDVLRRYTGLTGRPALPPAWSFGLWLTTSFTTDYNEEIVTSFIDGMAARDLPLHVFHFDCFWMKEFHWTDFQWNKEAFPDPEGMLRRLKEKGLKISVWINPYIAQRSALFAEGAAKGYLLKKRDGTVWQGDLWQPGMGIVDFTNPEACAWYAGKLRSLLEMGVDTFKTDFGERIPTDVVYYDGSDPFKMHNYYSYLYNRVVFNVLKEKFGEDKAVVFARSATAGSQKYPVHWGGDCSSSYQSMAETLRGGLSLGLCGFGFWSHDIGGFEETATPDLYKRWVAFGLLSSHSRLHGSSSYRVPWLFDEEAVTVLRFFTQLKCRLMPYLYQAACAARDEGLPVLRPMVLEFPEDPGCRYLDTQYMLGEALLVAPVFSADGEVSYYLPPGEWSNFFTGKKVTGGRWVREKHGYLSLPLLVRANQIIAVGDNSLRPDYDFAANVTLHLFNLEEGATAIAKVCNTEGRPELTVRAERRGQKIFLRTEAAGENKPWSLLLRGVAVEKVKKVAGGRLEPKDGDSDGESRGDCRIVPDHYSGELVIELL
jgi:alpha-D-xyloside xylohydrolase